MKKCSSHFLNVLIKCHRLADSYSLDEILPIHILYCITKEKGSLARGILHHEGLMEEDFTAILKPAKIDGIQNQKGLSAKFSTASKKIIEKTFISSSINKHQYVGTEHLLVCLIKHQDKEIKELLRQKSIRIQNLIDKLLMVLKSTSKFPSLLNNLNQQSALASPFPEPRQKTLNLEQFCRDLTSSKYQEKIDPVIGREEEIERIVQIILRRTKNNPILLGDAGVGKTAIVEGLAKKIYEGDVPDLLINKKILTLDLGHMIAGTMYRGEFESRLKQLMDEIRENQEIILFVDEFHTIIGAGAASGSMDAANLLKPMLARGELRCIGATTMEEYKKNIESDPALARRFQPVIIHEPSDEKTEQILEGIKKYFEEYHKIKISQDAISTAVKLSSRFITDRFQPDKSIDLIDEAAAKIRLKRESDGSMKKVFELNQQIKLLEKTKAQAVEQENFNQAILIKQKQEKLIAKKEDILLCKKSQNKLCSSILTKDDVIELVYNMTKNPLVKIFHDEKEKIMGLHKRLASLIIGQEEALAEIVNKMHHSYSGIDSSPKPLASFLFYGTSGVGKTETAIQLSRLLFHENNSLIRVDMSEFSEKFNISKLIGAPAGYVGYKETATLTDRVKKAPYSVVLFDEVEKAHADVYNLLLQILDTGSLTDAVGKKINFKNTIIIMTTNLGNKQLSKPSISGFGDDENIMDSKKTLEIKETLTKEINQYFPTEFLDRINQMVFFSPLTASHLEKIAQQIIADIINNLNKRGISISIPDNFTHRLVKQIDEPFKGAREVRRIIQKNFENRLALKILENKIKAGDKIDFN